MRENLVKHLGTAGLVLIIAGYFLYSVSNQFDWRAQAGIFGGAALILIYLAANFRLIRQALSSRQGQHGSMAGATLLLVVGILVLVNFLSFKNHKSFDLTEGGLYELSGQSKQLVENLHEELKITGFFTSAPGGQQFRDMMEKYQQASSQLQFEVIDPEEDVAAASRYEIKGNGLAVVESGAKKETIDLLSFQGGWQPDNEERITNAIIKVTRSRDKTVYFLQGHGERDIEDSRDEGFSMVAEALRKQNYQVETWNLALQDKLPESADVLVSAGPQVNFLPAEALLIRQFLAPGGKFFLLVDPQSDFDMNEGFLEDYGLALNQDIVLDVSGTGQLYGLGAAAPLAGSYADHPITAKLGNILTFYPRSQSISVSEGSLGYDRVELVKTTPQSWGEKDLEAEEVEFNQDVDRPGPLTLAAAATKTVAAEEESSAAPEESREGTEDGGAEAEGGEGEDEGQEEALRDESQDEEADQSRESRLVLFGDSDFATNQYFGISRNGDVFLLTVQWLAEDTDLLAIRPRSQTDRRVNLTAAQSQLIMWITAALIPLATLVVGFMVWSSRR
ncbi:MAG: Gldg family protein [Acidobacteriota bacterium]